MPAAALFSNWLWSTDTVETPPGDFTKMPEPPLSRSTVSVTYSSAAALGSKSMPWPGLPRKPSTTESSTNREPTLVTLIPSRPVPWPWIDSPRSTTMSLVPAVTTIPLTPAASTPAWNGVPSIVIALVIVTVPKPPGSSASISPPAAVLLIAPAKVLHGAVREQGLASSPTPDTHVRLACAWAGPLGSRKLSRTPQMMVIAPSLRSARAVVAGGWPWRLAGGLIRYSMRHAAYCWAFVVVGAPSVPLPAMRLFTKDSTVPPAPAKMPTVLLTTVTLVMRIVPVTPLPPADSPRPFSDATTLSRLTSAVPAAAWAATPAVVLLVTTPSRTVTRVLSWALTPMALLSKRVPSTEMLEMPPGDLAKMPDALLLRMTVLVTYNSAPALGSKSMPWPGLPRKPSTTESSTNREPTLVTLIPSRPVPWPWIDSPRSTTMSLVPAVTTIPLTPAASTPAWNGVPSIVIALVIVTVPKPPGSSASISPPAAVLLIAPAKVLHGAVREQGLASSTTPDTHVRLACAWAGPLGSRKLSRTPQMMVIAPSLRSARAVVAGGWPWRLAGGLIRYSMRHAAYCWAFVVVGAPSVPLPAMRLFTKDSTVPPAPAKMPTVLLTTVTLVMRIVPVTPLPPADSPRPFSDATTLSRLTSAVPAAAWAATPAVVLLVTTPSRTVTRVLSWALTPMALLSKRVPSTEMLEMPPGDLAKMPDALLLRMTVLVTYNSAPALGSKSMPWPGLPRKPSTTESSTNREPTLVTLIPSRPVPWPWIDSPRSTTMSLVPAVTTIPLTPAASTPAWNGVPSIVIALVIVTVPKPPGSSASISPPAAVLLIAPAKVLHGAVREQGLASSPTPDTHVRLACAWATSGWPARSRSAATTAPEATFIAFAL